MVYHCMFLWAPVYQSRPKLLIILVVWKLGSLKTERNFPAKCVFWKSNLLHIKAWRRTYNLWFNMLFAAGQPDLEGKWGISWWARKNKQVESGKKGEASISWIGAYWEDHTQKCFGVSGIETKCDEWLFPNSRS